MDKIRLLIAEDSMLMRDILKESISESFPEAVILEAGTGDDAQKLLQREQFSAVLCDWEMPGLSGMDLLNWVRKESGHAALPFIMVTGTAGKESVAKCIAAGVTDYVVKPFTPETICQKLEKILKK